MPSLVADALRRQAQECLETAKRTQDVAVREELLAAAAWLHEEAIKIEELLHRGGGGEPNKTPRSGSPFMPPKGGSRAAPHPWA